MKVQQATTFVGVLLLLTAILSSSACSDTAALIRQATYPPDFNYVSSAELRSSMDQLGYQLQELDQALMGNDAEQSEQQLQVLTALQNIERISTRLRAGPGGSNHPFLQDFMGDFVMSVGQARNAAAQDPPRYYLAGRVAGGCVNCHKINR